MHGTALLLLAITVITVAIAWAFALFRADARRGEADRVTVFRDPPIKKLERDQRLAFHGRVRQQIRVIPPTSNDR